MESGQCYFLGINPYSVTHPSLGVRGLYIGLYYLGTDEQVNGLSM